MQPDPIGIYPKKELLHIWEQDQKEFPCPDIKEPPLCLRCGKPLRRNLAENALSRALIVHVCPDCGIDEALRDMTGDVCSVQHWHAVQTNRLTEMERGPGPVLIPECGFQAIFDGPQKAVPLSGVKHPVSELVYSRSDFDGRKWWTAWFHCSEEPVKKELASKVDDFQNALFKLDEFRSLRELRHMCRLYAEPTSQPDEFNLYSETNHFYIWLRMITREKDYNLYVHYYLKAGI